MRDTIDINSNDNTLFVTGLCNNRCVMCCQPPTAENDIEFWYKKNLSLVKSAPKNLPVIGISGGEPFLAGKRFFDLLAEIKNNLPHTVIHVLTNGRLLSNEGYVLRIQEFGTANIIFGIPLHSDSQIIHDKIAGASNAYAETIRGLYNLATIDATIELRVVINKYNYQRLKALSVFIYRNLPFVRSVAFMAMEYIGYVVENSKDVWVEPLQYTQNLKDAVMWLAGWNMDVNIYNIPLCLLPEELHGFACQSISDWKNVFLPCCDKCSKRANCCGLFSTSKRIFNGIHTLVT